MTAVAASLPRAGQLPTEPGSWADFPSFIEVQFPVSKVSKESYTERKAVSGQTLTALGKWWGRKPLVLVRAAILGALLPSTDDPEADREVFMALMTMDDAGMEKRFEASIPAGACYSYSTPVERAEFFELDRGKPKWKRGVPLAERQRLQKVVFFRMGYDERLKYCARPEEIDGPSEDSWRMINAHLGTDAASLAGLVEELGQRRFGRTPRVADAFCGGGSIPFEAARIGCEAYGSDLNPVAALLTWGAINIVGGGAEVAERVRRAQREVFESVKKEVDALGIEKNEEGWVADAYLYCLEVTDPATGWRVPLSPSWVVAQKNNVIARLVPRPEDRSFDFEIVEGASDDEVARAAPQRGPGNTVIPGEETWRGGVVCPVDREGHWLPPTQRVVTTIEQLRGREGFRLWDPADFEPRPGDTLQERLYCIRWVDQAGVRHYRAPTAADLEREKLVVSLLKERFDTWQAKGFIPSKAIQPGPKTDEPIRTRGWTYWHHLFNPRQLLLNGLFAEAVAAYAHDLAAALLLVLGRVLEANNRLCRWLVSQSGGLGGTKGVFYNQALNPLLNYGTRTVATMESTAVIGLASSQISGPALASLGDARTTEFVADIWLTDPGYADSINYAELSEFFLAWYEKQLTQLFPDWYTDSKRALAVEGAGEDFRKAMVECYSRFTKRMPDNGLQVVMFTHQNAEVWADLALIMWAAGLQVVSAWTVATETEAAGIRQGNYVQGTVLLVLRKRRSERRGDMSDLFPDLQAEVQAQLQSMLALEDKEDPNFSDADYQLAAYAAALRVLTSYSSIDEVDIPRELARPRVRGERSPLVGLIERAVRIASDVLVPTGLERRVWRDLSPEERFYLKGVEVESHGDYREGVYQEYARGYGVREYRPLLASGTANQVRLKTPTEFRARDLAGEGFSGSLLRKVLFAIYKTAEEKDPRVGREYLRTELSDYWDRRQLIIALVTYLANRPKPETSMPHWKADVEAAQLLKGSIENDSI